ncbi:MAG: hypothetical protein WC966_02055 [Bradymonadales bacterium]|jgi:hypothetical protein
MKKASFYSLFFLLFFVVALCCCNAKNDETPALAEAKQNASAQNSEQTQPINGEPNVEIAQAALKTKADDVARAKAYAPNTDAPNEVDAHEPKLQAEATDGEPLSEDSLAITHDLSPLSPEQIAVLQNIQADAPPELLNAIKEEHENQHFLWSDELHPELYAESIANLGGTYIGIGSDQSYMFIGWQRPSLAFAVDYDPWVVYVHLAYFAFISLCDEPECVIEAFGDRDLGKEKLNAFYADDPRLKDILSVYQFGQRGIVRRLRGIRNTMNKHKIPSFMNDAETYEYIKQLIQSGRLRTFQANLLGQSAFAGIGAACTALQAPVAALYLSNAEQYWAYNAQFRQNMAALPFTQNALIMRTAATKPANRDYRYSVQPAAAFLAWLKHPSAKAVRYITRTVRVKAPDDFPFTRDEAFPPDDAAQEAP